MPTEQTIKRYLISTTETFIADSILNEYLLAKEKGIKYFHREYGMNNVYEDFAENFSIMVQGNKNLKLSKRILLIKKYLREE